MPAPLWHKGARATLTVLLALVAILLAGRATAQDRPLVEVLAELNRDGPWRILFQDAVVAGVRIRWPSEVRDVPNTLRIVLREAGLSLEVYPDTRTLIVVRPAPPRRRLSGTVVDAHSGERLSYAAIQVGRSGVAADASGQFTLVVSPDVSRMIVSYIGYEPDTLRAPFPDEIRIRLRPTVVERRGAVVLAGWSTFQPLGVGSLFGEDRVGGGMASMVSPGLAGSAGSPPEGLHVVLDGVPVYSPTHMLGARAAFAPEALRTLAYFDEGAPARFSDPPGGTLALVTRSGSTHRWEGEAGVNPTSVYGTAHGPIARDRASLLVSAQFGAPHLGAISQPLVQTVLAAPRRTTLPDTARTSVREQAASLYFHDLHLRVGRTWDSGAYAFLSVYTGGDRAQTSGTRWIQRSLTDPTLQQVPVRMRSSWGSQTASAQGTLPAAGWLLSGAMAWSHYTARFAQSDFRFAYAPDGAVNPVRRPLDSLQFANTLWEVRATVSGTRSLNKAHTLVLGTTLIQFRSVYEERSGRFLPAFGEIRESPQVDFFGEHVTNGRLGTLHSGLRAHAFLNGRFVRLAPRLRFETPLNQRFTASLALSRNHQFVHALGFPYTPTPRVWVLSTKGEPPLSASSGFATVRYRMAPVATLYVRGYVREMTGVRLHEASAGSGLTEPVTLQAPWRSDLAGFVRGVQMGVQAHTHRAETSLRYTRSSVILREPGGMERPAPWDRRHLVEGETQIVLTPNVSLGLRARWASGAPNHLHAQFPDEPHRLPAVGSADAGLRWTHPSYGMEVHLGVTQALGGSSVWYRDFVEIRTGAGEQERLLSTPTDILDSGPQPFFLLRLRSRPLP